MKLSDKEVQMVRDNRAKSLLTELTALYRSMNGGWSADVEKNMLSVISRHMIMNEN